MRQTSFLVLLLSACGAPLDLPLATAESPVLDARAAGAHRLALGAHHGCLVLPSSDLACWGLNTYGEIGTPTSLPATGPAILVAGLHGAVQVAAGGALTCALDAAGDIWCFGDGAFGALGRSAGTTVFSTANPIPAKIGASGPFTRVTAGERHACGLRQDGMLFCWGAATYGQVGIIGRRPAGLPILVGGPYVDVAAGANHTCALRADRTVACFGRGDLGALGDGTGATNAKPQTVVVQGGAALGEVVAIGSGWGGSCALRSDGRVLCWGSGDYGQLGDGVRGTHSALVATPTQLPQASSALGLGSMALDACARSARGDASCFGDDRSGKLGSNGVAGPGPLSYTLDPRLGTSNIAELTTGGDQTCALLIDGQLACAGLTSHWNGALVQTVSTVGSQVLIPSSPTSIAHVAAGDDHSCGVRTDGSVACWGGNAYGQLGVGTQSSYVPLSPLLSEVRDLAAGRQFTCVARGRSEVACWGRNDFGQLGAPTTAWGPNPVFVYGTLGALSVTAGARHACAVQEGGTGVCWGDNSSGQLGDGSFRSGPQPVSVSVGGIVKLVAGEAHTCALAKGGTLQCWGANASGQLGNGSFGAPVSGPSNVLGLPQVVDVVAGRAHTCALGAKGDVYCWGDNLNGQVGDGSTTARSLPVAVLSGVVALAAGGNNTCALNGAGGLSCWGAATEGQMADGPVRSTDQLTPVAIGALTDPVRSVSVGAHHILTVISPTGTRNWGRNTDGQLGVGPASFWGTPVVGP